MTNIHLLPGRIRVEIPGLYRNPQWVRQLEEYFCQLTGVEQAKANFLTGKLLICYNQQLVNLQEIINKIKELFPTSTARQEAASTVCTLSTSVNPVKKIPVSWHSMTSQETVASLNSHFELGLTAREWQARLAHYGPNILAEREPLSFWKLMWEQFQGFMVKLMLGAGAVSFLLGEVVDALTIVAIVFLEALIGVAQEYRAEKSLAALNDLAAPSAWVYRDGEKLQVPAKDLVPGDLIAFEAGDHIPADARLLETVNLEVVESALTGESMPVSKDPTVVQQGYSGIGEQRNMVFMGTNVTKGRGKAMVVATGMDTQIGQIAQMLNEITNKPTPLQLGLDKLGKNLTLGCIGICGLIAFTGILRGKPVVEMLRTGVTLAVGAMPEGLSAIVTLAMAFGVQRMVKRNALVRKLPAVENIGYANVICSDKTGTLTKNEMTVKEIYTYDTQWEVTGDGYLPQGFFKNLGREVNPAGDEHLHRVLAISALCNNSRLIENKPQEWSVQGDPTEGALLVAAAKAGLTDEAIQQAYSRFREIPFDSNRRRMSVVCSDQDNQYYIYTKGAPDTILELCSQVYHAGQIKPLGERQKKKILASNEKMSKKALRVLALAYKPLQHDPNQVEELHLEQGLVFAGLVGMSDPPREEAKRAIEKCRQAGIKVVMITGDQENTATAIAKDLSLLEDGLVVTGEQLAGMSDWELVEIIDKIQVCTRTSPEQKLRIVRAFQQRKYIVAMTGDGVNDAPAIKESDIGIAMGGIGTDVTREASCITLTDDNFATIVMAVEEGRTIGSNIRKAIRYILSGNLGEVISIFLAAVAGLPLPLVPCQILWMNLVTEGIMSFTLVTDPAYPEIMDKSPADPKRNVLGGKLGRRIFARGLGLGLTNFGVFVVGLLLTGGNLLKARTMAFANLIVSQLLHALDYRVKKGRIRTEAFRENKYLLPSLLVSAGLLVGIIYPPVFQGIFQTTALSLMDWLVVFGGALTVNLLEKIFYLISSKPRVLLPQLT